jgi:hypothetical protein
MRTLSSDEDILAYLAEKHADIASRNPGRDFEIIWKRGSKKENGNSKMELVAIWLDGKGELND